ATSLLLPGAVIPKVEMGLAKPLRCHQSNNVRGRRLVSRTAGWLVKRRAEPKRRFPLVLSNSAPRLRPATGGGRYGGWFEIPLSIVMSWPRPLRKEFRK